MMKMDWNDVFWCCSWVVSLVSLPVFLPRWMVCSWWWWCCWLVVGCFTENMLLYMCYLAIFCHLNESFFHCYPFTTTIFHYHHLLYSALASDHVFPRVFLRTFPFTGGRNSFSVEWQADWKPTATVYSKTPSSVLQPTDVLISFQR